MTYDIEDQQLHQQAVATLVSRDAAISWEKTYQTEFVGSREYVIVSIKIRAQGSVGHPWRYDGWYWTEPVGNPAQRKNVIMAQWFPLAEVVHQPLQIFYTMQVFDIILAHLVDDIFEMVILDFDPYTFNRYLESHQISKFATKLIPTSTL